MSGYLCEHNLAITQTRISDLMVNQRQFGKLLENHCVTLCAGQGNMSGHGSESAPLQYLSDAQFVDGTAVDPKWNWLSYSLCLEGLDITL